MDYAHDRAEKTSDMECLPERLRGRRYYEPTEEGFEKRVRDRLAAIREAKALAKDGE